MRHLSSTLAVLLSGACALAAPPAVEIPVDQLKPVNGYVTMTPKGDAEGVSYVPLSGAFPIPSAVLADPRVFCLPVQGLKAGKYDFIAVGSLGKEHTHRPFSVVVGDGPAPKPDDPPPKPDDPPAPKPTSFRVILVYESGDTLTAAQTGVLYGRAVEEYLAKHCGKAGWQRRDKDADPAADTTDLKAVWAAAKPSIASVPCAVIALDGRIVIEPLAGTPAEMVKVFDKYREGK